MTHRPILVALTILGCISPGWPLSAQTAPGVASSGEVQDLCKGNGVPEVACNAFLRGTFEGIMVGQLVATDGELSFCLPDEGVALGDIRQTFLDFVSAEPGRRSEEASLLLLESLEDRYPCLDAPGAPDGDEVPEDNVAAAGPPPFVGV